MTSEYSAPTDVISRMLGIDDSSPITALRNRKPELIPQLQRYYDAVFVPGADSAAALALRDRALVAIRVASHTQSQTVADWYAELARSAGADQEVVERARDVGARWTDETLLGAAMRHADLLTTHPIDAQPEDIAALKHAGFSPAGILSLSQTIAFVSYQLRLVAGLRAFGEQR